MGAPGNLRLGWAAGDVTPDRPTSLRGQFYVRVSERVNDPITVTALAVEGTADDGPGDQAILISCDRVGIPGEMQERVRETAAPRLPGFDVRKLFLNATHTHTAPGLTEGMYPPQGPDVMTPTEYAEIFVSRTAEAAVEAWENRAPGGLSRAFGHAVVGHNRRMVYFDGSARMYGKTNDDNFDCIEGYQDHSVDLLFTWDDAGALTGVVVNLACPSQVTEHGYYVSSDFWHETRVEIRKRHGEGVFILPQCAPAGDQSPHFLLYGEQERAMRERKGVSESEEIAQRIANAVDYVFEAAKGSIQTSVPVRHVVRTLDLPVRMVTDEELAHARSELERLEAEKPSDEKSASANCVHRYRNRRVIERYEKQQASPHFPMELHVLRLGEVAMATNPFELFLDFGLRIKARSRAPQTMLVQLACGTGGYLPTEKAVRARSYGAEIASNQVGPEGGQVLVNETLRDISALWERA